MKPGACGWQPFLCVYQPHHKENGMPHNRVSRIIDNARCPMLENAMLTTYPCLSVILWFGTRGRSLHPMLSPKVILKDPESTHVSESSSNGYELKNKPLSLPSSHLASELMLAHKPKLMAFTILDSYKIIEQYNLISACAPHNVQPCRRSLSGVHLLQNCPTDGKSLLSSSSI